MSSSASSTTTVQGTPNPVLQACLSANAEWSSSISASDPSFFANSAKGQSPGVLWFGCSDSRVPESVVLNRKPGEVFVHRNIANQVQEGDDSAQSVLSFAVGALGVRQSGSAPVYSKRNERVSKADFPSFLFARSRRRRPHLMRRLHRRSQSGEAGWIQGERVARQPSEHLSFTELIALTRPPLRSTATLGRTLSLHRTLDRTPSLTPGRRLPQRPHRSKRPSWCRDHRQLGRRQEAMGRSSQVGIADRGKRAGTWMGV